MLTIAHGQIGHALSLRSGTAPVSCYTEATMEWAEPASGGSAHLIVAARPGREEGTVLLLFDGASEVTWCHQAHLLKLRPTGTPEARVVRTVSTGAHPGSVAVDPERGRVFVTNGAASMLGASGALHLDAPAGDRGP